MEPQGIVKCAARSCERWSYANEVERVFVGARVLPLCQDCYGAIKARMSDKQFIALMYKSTMSVAEVQRMRRERAELYAMRDFTFSDDPEELFAVAGYPQRLALPAPGVVE